MKKITFLTLIFMLFSCSKSEKVDNDMTVADYSWAVNDTTEYDYGFDEPVDFEEDYKLVLEFGDENLPDEYLIAVPNDISVQHNGDIIISDEYKLKVYDKYGKPKQIIGRKGQGPGEFVMPPFTWVSETGYISAMHGQFYSIYSPDYKFISMNNIYSSGILECAKTGLNTYRNGNLNYIHSLSPDINLFLIKVNDKDNTKDYYQVVYQNGKEFETVVSVTIEDPQIYLGVGSAEIVFMNDGRILYGNTRISRPAANNKREFSLFILNLKTSDQKEIKITYDPILIPDDYYEAIRYAPGNMDKKKRERRVDKMKKMKYLSPIKQLLTDGDYIFICKNTDNSIKDNLYEVYDSRTGALVYEFSISSVNFYMISHGYVYAFNNFPTEGTFPKVQKYRLHPRLYGK